MGTASSLSADFKKSALRKKLLANINHAGKSSSVSTEQRSQLDYAVKMKKEEVRTTVPLTKKERERVNSALKPYDCEIKIKNGKVKFMSPTSLSNFEKRDANLREKKQTLNDYLKKVEARKTDYKIVKGEYKVESKVNANKVTSLKYSDNAINSRRGNPKSVVDKKITQNKTNGGGALKSSLKHYSKDFAKMASSSFAKQNDIGTNVIGVGLVGGVAVATNAGKLLAINGELMKKGFKAGKFTYKVGKDFYLGAKTGTIKGTLNMYRHLTFLKAKNTIKYAKGTYMIMNTIQGTKVIALKTHYNVIRAITFAKGIKNHTMKVTKKEALNLAYKSGRGIGRFTYKTGKGAVRLTKSRVVKKSFNFGTSSIKKLTRNGNETGVQALGTTVDSLKYAYKADKAGIKVAKVTAKTFYKTGRGTIRFAKNVKKEGFKGATKIWYNAHLKGAGKRLSEKFIDRLTAAVKKVLKSPAVLGALGFFLCVSVVLNTVTVSATSVVGGVVEFFEELGEGLAEVVDNVATAIGDFFSWCVDWVVGLFSDDETIEVDVDVGDDLSICEYLLGVVQLYKSNFGIELLERYNELIDDNHHAVYIHDLYGGDIELFDPHDVEKGLANDQVYVRVMLPIWKAIILGTIGTDFSGRQANEVSQEIFETMTISNEEPRADIDGDGEADYLYCDNSKSLEEGENKVYINIGGTELISGAMDTCFNNTGMLTHESHNTDGLSCCITDYHCTGGHLSYCDAGAGCTNHTEEIEFCENINVCKFGGTCAGHISYICNGHSYYCYYGYRTTPVNCGSEEPRFRCNGYCMCLGHRIMDIYIGSKDFEEMLNDYFLETIEELKAEDELDEEERDKLAEYEMYYEYALGTATNGDPIADEFFENFGDYGDVTYSDIPSLDYSDCTLTPVTQFALSHIGLPYKWGGNSLISGCDCSGFVREVHRSFGIIIAERTAHNMCFDTSCGYEVPLSSAQPGDLIFYWDNEEGRVAHVAMYIGNGKIVHERGKKWGCRVDNMLYWNAIYRVKRYQ